MYMYRDMFGALLEGWMYEEIATSLVFVAGRRVARALGYCEWCVNRHDQRAIGQCAGSICRSADGGW
jgi:hypothetical protein